MSRFWRVLLPVAMLGLAMACGGGEDKFSSQATAALLSPTPTPTLRPAVAPTKSPIASNTPTPRPTATLAPSPTATDTPTRTPTATPTLTVRFAVIGDYGVKTQEHLDVASLVKSWEPDFIVTTGDNHYFCYPPPPEPEVFTECKDQFTLEQRIGESYGVFIEAGRFWPTVGNHEYSERTAIYHAIPYLNYFDLPGDELTYTVIEGPVQFFFIDNGRQADVPPQPVTADSPQGYWLKGALAASAAAWKVVVMHFPPYTSRQPGQNEVLRWPYREWGADLLLAEHGHQYERLVQPDGLSLLVNGLGGHTTRHEFLGVIPESRFQYNDGFGAQRCEATVVLLSCSFINTDGEVIDTLTLQRVAR